MQPAPSRALSSSLLAMMRERRGATAIEFGLLVAPFCFLVLAIFELALVVLVAGNLDTATSDAARQSAVAGGVATADGVAATICTTMPSFGRDCAAALDVTLTPLPAQPGQSAIVMVRAVYLWPLFSPLLGRVLPGGGGEMALVATSAFRPEAS
jgi:Flp pilus assembly protein TadG